MALTAAEPPVQRTQGRSTSGICLIAYRRGMPCPIRSSTCRNFETISSRFGLLFAILGPPFPEHSSGSVRLVRLKRSQDYGEKTKGASLVTSWLSDLVGHWLETYRTFKRNCVLAGVSTNSSRYYGAMRDKCSFSYLSQCFTRPSRSGHGVLLAHRVELTL